MRKWLDKSVSRLVMLLLFGILVNILIVARLISYYMKQDEKMVPSVPALCKLPIFDRNYTPIAFSTQLYSAYIDPSEIDDPEEVLNTLEKKIPELDITKIKKQWSSDKRFIWLARYLDNPEVFENLGREDIFVIQDIKRVYPQNNTCAHIVGFVDVDQKGLSGVEYRHDKKLEKESVQLSLDTRLQNHLREALMWGMEEYSAKAANGMIINADTGEILAMVTLPDFNPNDRKTITKDNIFDRNTLGVYEFGSILKTTTLALALNSRQFRLKDQISIPVYLPYGKYKITDISRNHIGSMSVCDTLVYSSNKGMAIMALQVGQEKQQEMFRLLGYYDQIVLPIPTARSVIPRVWNKGTTITASYGYGFALTPLHVMRGFARLVTGKKVQLSLYKLQHKPVFEEIFPEHMVNDMHYALRQVVLEGSGRKAEVKGIFMGGKTGTANQLSGRHYVKGNNITTFIGCFPITSDRVEHIDKPKYIFMVSLQSPKASLKTAGYATGGQIAAPVAKILLEKIAPLLNIFVDETAS